MVNPHVVISRLPVSVTVPYGLIPQDGEMTIPTAANATSSTRQAKRLYVGNLPPGTTDVCGVGHLCHV